MLSDSIYHLKENVLYHIDIYTGYVLFEFLATNRHIHSQMSRIHLSVNYTIFLKISSFTCIVFVVRNCILHKKIDIFFLCNFQICFYSIDACTIYHLSKIFQESLIHIQLFVYTYIPLIK